MADSTTIYSAHIDAQLPAVGYAIRNSFIPVVLSTFETALYSTQWNTIIDTNLATKLSAYPTANDETIDKTFNSIDDKAIKPTKW